MTTAHQLGKWRRHLLALVVACSLVVTHASPADARRPHYGSEAAARYYAGCPASGGYYQPWGRVYVTEYGKKGVVRFKARFKLYRTNETGIHIPKLEKTYRTVEFPNDQRAFQSYLPVYGNHQWTDVYGTNEYQLDVKLTWERRWRPDWNHQFGIVRCQGI